MLMLTDGNIDNASARIRAILYIRFFESRGYKVNYIPRIPQRASNLVGKYTVFPFLKRWYYLKMVIVFLLGRWDVVFIQRIFISKNLLKLFKRRSIPFIYDLDDAIYLNSNRPSNRERTANMIKYASKVIVSTDYLQEFCSVNGQKAEIIPSPVETDRIRQSIKLRENIVTIGWIGSPWTTVFLELIETPLKKLAEKYSFIFLTVGAKPEYKIAGINHIAKRWIFGNENEDIAQMDIGIMPLPDTEFARMKGGYKLLQYMSAGIPCVASPVGINQSIVRNRKNGFLASTDEEWVVALETLINDPELRWELGSNGRKDAVELFSREVCFEKLFKIIQEL
jgi:glycosyltransferase involved in cell wall biosynthesis